MASERIRQLPSGKYQYRFTYDGKTYSVTADKKSVAKKRGIAKEAQVIEGDYVDKSDTTFSEVYERWISLKANTVKSSTLFSYKSLYRRYFKDTFGDMRIQKIETSDIKNLIERLSKTNTHCTLSLIHAVLTDIFNTALNDKIIKNNPSASIKLKDIGRKIGKKKLPVSKTVHRALSYQESAAFLKESDSMNEWYRFLFKFMLNSGVRVGEAAGLKWSDIDEKAGKIRIQRTTTRNTEGKFVISDETKTEAGTRELELTDDLKEVLSGQRKMIYDFFGFNAVKKDAHVFRPQWKGNIVLDSTVGGSILHVIREVEKNQGIKMAPFSSHAFRDTYSTRLINDYAVSPKIVQQILGHQDVSITLNKYDHPTERNVRDAVKDVHIEKEQKKA